MPGKSLAALLWLPLLWPALHAPSPGDAELTVVDGGQGLSVLVRTRHHALLYDMGPAVPDGFDAGDRVVVPALHALGVPRGLAVERRVDGGGSLLDRGYRVSWVGGDWYGGRGHRT